MPRADFYLLGGGMIELPKAGRVLLDHWLDVKKEAAVPSRGKIWPGALRAVLSHVVTLEWTGEGRLVFRLAGTGVVHSFGCELRGTNLFDLLPEADPLAVPPMLSAVCDHPCGAFFELAFPGRQETPALYQMVYLPLEDEDGVRTRMIGTITAPTRDHEPWDAWVPVRALRCERVSYLDLGAGLPG